MEKRGIKLSLNKETIAGLNKESLDSIKGGVPCSYALTQCCNSIEYTYCPNGVRTDCKTGCYTSCSPTACYTWCDCESLATGTCC